jgi:large repetitive protein
VAVALVVVLALAGLAIWALASGGGDGGNDGHDTDVSTEVEQPGGTDGGSEGTTGSTGGGNRTTTTTRGPSTTRDIPEITIAEEFTEDVGASAD